MADKLEGWQKRLFEEREELEIKLRRLNLVLTNKTDLNIQPNENRLMLEQFKAMSEYHKVLSDRICRLEIPDEIN